MILLRSMKVFQKKVHHQIKDGCKNFWTMPAANRISNISSLHCFPGLLMKSASAFDDWLAATMWSWKFYNWFIDNAPTPLYLRNCASDVVCVIWEKSTCVWPFGDFFESKTAFVWRFTSYRPSPVWLYPGLAKNLWGRGTQSLWARRYAICISPEVLSSWTEPGWEQSQILRYSCNKGPNKPLTHLNPWAIGWELLSGSKRALQPRQLCNSPALTDVDYNLVIRSGHTEIFTARGASENQADAAR